MEQSTQRKGFVNLLALLLVGVAGFAVARYSSTLAGQVGIAFIGLGVLVAAVSWFQMRLEDNERIEKLEFEELAKAHSGSALFEAKDAELFPVQRSREQFERFFVPVFTALLCLLQAGGAYLFWRWLSRAALVTELKQPNTALALFGLFALVLFMVGKFSATFARLEGHRLLRPGSGYTLLGAYISFAVALGVVGVEAGFPKTDFLIARVLCALLALVALETLVNLVLEMYRPQVKGKVERPLYESRLVGLLGQPEGLITTAAQALDYQFGFKVSETWFYRFFERALAGLLLFQLGVLLLSTGVVFIEAGEQGLLERFGRPVAGRTILEAGAHLKWPWPIDAVTRFRTEQIQSFDVGLTPEEGKEQERVVLWTRQHARGSEDNFIVANRESGAGALETTNGFAGKRTPPVSLITGTIPVQFQITNLMAWAYNNWGAPALLQDLATREIVRYFVAADMNEVMSYGRLEASQELAARIQAASDRYGLGARIVSVSLQDLHPPVKVAEDFEKVVGATQVKLAKILAARADYIATNAMADAQAVTIVNKAQADKSLRVSGALAKAGLFTNQIPAFEAAPAVYAQRAYLQSFALATANARKYILLTTNVHDVIQFDLQDKIPYDILNSVTVPPPKK
jgi:regulator of protease activity HflC (stomatin/prohibitin superfamily)